MLNIKFTTDQSGANHNICSGSSQIFNFSVTNTYSVAYADISLKKGSGTTASIVCSIYDQPNGGGNLVSSSTVLAADVSQSYSSIIFPFSTTTVSAGISYSLAITSTESCVGSNPYSMKSGNFQVLNSDTGAILNIGYGILANVATVCSLTASATTSTPGQKIYLGGFQIPKFKIGSKTPKIYKGNITLYNPNNL